jgi:hypothetical protein
MNPQDPSFTAQMSDRSRLLGMDLPKYIGLEYGSKTRPEKQSSPLLPLPVSKRVLKLSTFSVLLFGSLGIIFFICLDTPLLVVIAHFWDQLKGLIN